jgi:prophage regulatory protein
MKFLRIKQVMQATGLSRMTIYRLELADKFPKRRQLSENSVAWLESDISAVWRFGFALQSENRLPSNRTHRPFAYPQSYPPESSYPPFLADTAWARREYQKCDAMPIFIVFGELRGLA